MTYRADMEDLALGLGRLIIRGGLVDVVDLDIALNGYQATSALLTDLHAELTDIRRPKLSPHVAEVERHPVALLGRLLHRTPRVSDGSPSELLSKTPATAEGAIWQDVARTATLAQHDWHNADPATRPIADAAWSELADVASLTQALADAVDDLADSLEAAGRTQTATALRLHNSSGIRVAAEQTTRLAAGGPLPDARELQPRVPPRVLAVRQAEDLPEAFRRLTALVTASTTINPQEIELLTNAVASATAVGARTLAAAGHPEAAAFLQRHAELLGAAAGSSRRLASMDPPDVRAVAQAQQIHQHLAGAQRRQSLPDPTVVRSYAGELPALTDALNQAAQRQLRTGAWLSPSERADAGRPSWAPATAGPQEPRLTAALWTAAKNANGPEARVHFPRPSAVPALGSRPREILSAALNRQQGAARPTELGRRLGPPPRRGR